MAELTRLVLVVLFAPVHGIASDNILGPSVMRQIFIQGYALRFGPFVFQRILIKELKPLGKRQRQFDHVGLWLLGKLNLIFQFPIFIDVISMRLVFDPKCHPSIHKLLFLVDYRIRMVDVQPALVVPLGRVDVRDKLFGK